MSSLEAIKGWIGSGGAYIRVMADFLGEFQPEWCHPLHIVLHHDAESSNLHHTTSCMSPSLHSSPLCRQI